MFQRQAGTGPHLNLITFGDRQRETGRDRMTIAGIEDDLLGRHHIHAGGVRGRIGGDGEPEVARFV